ncbi:penicillin amidase [Pigmentiphaga sp. NML080357]|uniref:penicillin acylase family protein n=1 Tax=Pigmentiphaga sp. NML080357 TaxID=2008675 RepID=UPI000B40A3DA|nr:penicillin acylase family protein [Pigmentiphaga sp. NML080357]OVZ58295.1 penicillin amidase [Pigmentiphaga sp. NML080357]
MDHAWRRTATACSVSAALLLAACGGGDDDGPSTPPGNGGNTLPGLKESVEIIRDRYGVSHIYAKNQEDMFFAQGYNAARDRLWQLDQWRRQGEGKMAEQFGPRFVEADRAARMFLYRGDLQKEYASYHPDAQAIIAAFVAGINAYIDQVKADPAKLPLEFRLTGTEPDHWRPETVLVRKYGITRNIGSEVALARSVNVLGAEKVQELSIFEPPIELRAPAGVDLSQIDAAIMDTYNLGHAPARFQASDFPKSPLGASERDMLAKTLSGPQEATGANAIADAMSRATTRHITRYESNNWTISGTRTASGKPILSNDPHRALSMPSLRYMVHLNSPGWNVIGAGEPALPGISIGHNERIAFGLTIFSFGDEEDLYVYETNPANRDEYRYQGKWEKMKIVEETIKVRGQADVKAQIKFTRHGPVLHEDPARGKAYAMRAAYLEFPGTAAYLASLRLNQAQNWEQFTAGMARHYTPGENMVYADVEGNIGWFGGAIAPIRPKADWSGLLPVPGDGTYEWNGFLPGESLPRVFNPAKGFYATANEYNVPDGYDHKDMSAREWSDPDRVQRLNEVLGSARGLTVQDTARLQYDVLSVPARELMGIAAGLSSPEAEVADALRRLKAWDYRMSADSEAATIYEFWQYVIVSKVSNLYVPAAGRELIGELPKRLVMSKLKEPDAAFGANPVAGRDALLLDALKEGLANMKAVVGNDPAKWKWGDLFHIKFDHQLAALLPESQRAALGTDRYPMSGNIETVYLGAYGPDFRKVHGASYRQALDVGNWDNSLAMNVPGQSADPSSPYYKNLLPLWAKGDLFPMAFSRQKVESLKADSVTLQPRK